MTRKPNIRKLTQEVAAFNDAVKPGDDVIVIKDDGRRVQTRTRSEAWILGGHTAVVLLEGISGGYLLERVRR